MSRYIVYTFSEDHNADLEYEGELCSVTDEEAIQEAIGIYGKILAEVSEINSSGDVTRVVWEVIKT